MENLFLIAIYGFFIVYVRGQIELDVYHEPSITNSFIRTRRHATPRPPGNESADLNKFMNLQYYSIIRVGSPAQEFKISFSTTWSDSWLPSSRCGWNEFVCIAHNQYDSSKSSTYISGDKFINITSSEFSLMGKLATDTIHLDHVQVANQSFIEATHLSLEPFMRYIYDGIFGLGLEKSASFSGTVPFFYNMLQQGLLQRKMFSFYMNRDETTTRAGRILFGGGQRKHVKNNTLSILDVIDDNYWKIGIDGINITSKTSPKTSFPIAKKSIALLDSTESTILGPPDAIRKIHYAMNAKYFPFIDKYGVNCREITKLPDINFLINGNIYTIESKYYIEHMAFSNVQACFSPFKPSKEENSNYWELGGAFMMQLYTEFDLENKVINIGETIF